MATPKIIIFAQGGTHGDFLYSCCQLMTNETENTINEFGRVLENSKFKRNNLETYKKGKKIPFEFDTMSNIEICHIWQEEFKNLSGKFYYIHYNDEQIGVIKKMYLEKACDNNIEYAMENLKRYLPDVVVNKISKDNFNKILTLSYKNLIKKYKQQPGIVPIEITDLYDFDKLVGILKHMDIFDASNTEKLKKFHESWTSKNSHYITEMLKVNAQKQ